MSRRHTFLGRLWRLLLIKLPIALVVLSLLLTVMYKWLPVYVTPLMVQRSIEFRHDDSFHTHKVWKSYRNISPELARAVIASEDNLFEAHGGFDWKAIRQAREEFESGKRSRMRGASTISQQTAKNVFLLPSRSFIRKGLEAYFTVLIEFIWGKERILEVYLNVAEMGKGIYGAEAETDSQAVLPHCGMSAKSAQEECREAFLVCEFTCDEDCQSRIKAQVPGMDIS